MCICNFVSNHYSYLFVKLPFKMIALLLVALFLGTMANPAEVRIPAGIDFGNFAMTWPAHAPAVPKVNEETIVTRHIPPGLRGNMKLTTGELKLFAGFALNIIRHKCKDVDSQKLFQIQKYIGKRISDTKPVRGGQSKDFDELISKMSTCAKDDGPKALPTIPLEKSNSGSFSPLDSLRSILSSPLEFLRKHNPEDKSADESTMEKNPKDEVEIVDVPPQSPDSQPKVNDVIRI